MRSEAITRGEQGNEIAGDIERLDGADAKALDIRLLEDLAEEIRKFDPGRKITTVRAEIDAAQNDFFVAGIGKALNLGNDGGDGKAAGFSADKWNNAEGAARIATVLDLEGGASVIPFPSEDGRDQDIGDSEDIAPESGGGRGWDECPGGFEKGERKKFRVR